MKSGFISILGKPNAGKSSLTNVLVGEKISIVTFRPQTTRDTVTGIMQQEGVQAVLYDTPGILRSKNELGKYMMKNVREAKEAAEFFIYVIAADKGIGETDIDWLERLKDRKGLIVVNKIDIADKEFLGHMLEKLSVYERVVIPVSCYKGTNLDLLKKEIVSLLPEDEAYYPDDMITDKSVRFMAQEIIREKALLLLGDEVPYGVGVNVTRFEEGGTSTFIDADVYCEKKAHKGIIIGKNGSMLKEIGTKARKDLERLLDAKVMLTLFVKVKENWREDASFMKDLGYELR